MSVLAIIRPDEWNLPLLVHVLGAFLLIGALFTAALLLFAGRGGGTLAAARGGYRTLLYGALPSYLVMRIGAQWVASEEGVADADFTWITLGYASTEGGLLLLIGATVAAGLAVRKATRAEGAGVTGSGVSVAAYIVAFLIVLYMVMIWVMTSKPA